MSDVDDEEEVKLNDINEAIDAVMITTTTHEEVEAGRKQEQLSGEKPKSKEGKRGKQQQKSPYKNSKDISQDSVVKKLQQNKIYDSDEERVSEEKKPRRLKKLNEQAKAEIMTMEVVEPEEPQPRQRLRNQKRSMMIDSEEDNDANNELDVGTKENKNLIGNMMKKNMGATSVNLKKQAEQEVKEGIIQKGKRKVKKTREFTDEDGYFVIEDYSSYEEYDLPQPKESIIKAKTTLNIPAGNAIAQKQPQQDSKAKN